MSFYLPVDITNDILKNNATELRDLCESLIQQSAAISIYAKTALTPLDIIKTRETISDNIGMGNTFKNLSINCMLSAFESGHAIRSHLSTWLLSLACLDHEDWDISFSEITKNSRRAAAHELNDILSTWCKDNETLSLFQKSTAMSGADSSVSVEESPFDKTRIIQSSGFKLPFSIPPEFWSAVSRRQIEVLDAKIILVDGVVLTIGEIHHILEDAYSSNQPIFIFARGFGEEIIGTLIQNYKIGKLKVFPVVIPLGMLANIIYDISDLIGNSVISIINGETLQSLELNNLESVSLIRMDEQNIVMINPKNNDPKNIVKKIRDEFREISFGHNKYSTEVEPSFNARLNFLSNKRVEILLGENSFTPAGTLKDRLQTLFTIYNEIVETGIIEIEDIKDEIPELLYDSFRKYDIKYIPSATLCYAISVAASKQKLLKNTEKFLLIDT